MTKNSKGVAHLFILIILALIIVGGIGYYAYKNGQIKLTPLEKSSVPPAPTANQAPDGSLANWKTYKNEKYGFELKYPEEFEVKEEFDGDLKVEFTNFIPKDKDINGRIAISYNSPHWPLLGRLSRKSLLSFIDIVGEAFAAFPLPTSLGKIKIDNVFGEHKAVISGDGELHNIFFQNNKTKFEIVAEWGHMSDMPFAPSYPGEKPPDYSRDQKVIMDALDQILSTFKFLDEKNPWDGSVCGNGVCEACENECCNYPCKETKQGEVCPPPTCLGYCPQDCQQD